MVKKSPLDRYLEKKLFIGLQELGKSHQHTISVTYLSCLLSFCLFCRRLLIAACLVAYIQAQTSQESQQPTDYSLMKSRNDTEYLLFPKMTNIVRFIDF